VPVFSIAVLPVLVAVVAAVATGGVVVTVVSVATMVVLVTVGSVVVVVVDASPGAPVVFFKSITAVKGGIVMNPSPTTTCSMLLLAYTSVQSPGERLYVAGLETSLLATTSTSSM